MMHHRISFKNALDSTVTISEPLSDIVGDGTVFWLISESHVYSGSPGSLQQDSGASKEIPEGTKPLAILFDAGFSSGAGRILIAASDGTIYSHSSSGWSRIAVKSNTALGPLCLLFKPSGSGPSTRMLIGRQDSGYMEYDETQGFIYEGGSNYLSSSQSIYNSTILAKRVQGFWQPLQDPNILFILLAAGKSGSYALFHNVFDSSQEAWSGWQAE